MLDVHSMQHFGCPVGVKYLCQVCTSLLKMATPRILMHFTMKGLNSSSLSSARLNGHGKLNLEHPRSPLSWAARPQWPHTLEASVVNFIGSPRRRQPFGQSLFPPCPCVRPSSVRNLCCGQIARRHGRKERRRREGRRNGAV